MHTVAVPDWRSVVDIRGELTRDERTTLLSVLDQYRDRLVELVDSGALPVGGPANQLPAQPFVVDVARLVAGDVGVMAEIDVWWRLDVIDAVDDWLIAIDE